MTASQQQQKKSSKPTKIDPGTRRVLNRFPILQVAFSIARNRFSHLPDVLGLGIGRQYHESIKKYGAAPAHTGGFCIKVLVEKKKKTIPRKERIPRFINVSMPGNRIRHPVLIDIVTFARSRAELTSKKKLQEGRGWPTAESITPGRLFTFGKKAAGEYGQEFTTSNQVRLGTTGAVIKTKAGELYAFSAGHVFTDPCRGQTDRPEGTRAIGVKDKSFVAVEGDAFAPNSLERIGNVISDVMGYRIPRNLLPADFSWPDGFSGELATPNDIERAILEEGKITGFIWVERSNLHRPQAIPVDLELRLTGFKDKVNCGGTLVPLEYGVSWGLLFMTDEETFGGDSGAGVFLISEDGFHSRLLGFHFLKSGGRSYAMDAETFFKELLGHPSSELIFA